MQKLADWYSHFVAAGVELSISDRILCASGRSAFDRLSQVSSIASRTLREFEKAHGDLRGFGLQFDEVDPEVLLPCLKECLQHKEELADFLQLAEIRRDLSGRGLKQFLGAVDGNGFSPRQYASALTSILREGAQSTFTITKTCAAQRAPARMQAR